MALSSTTPPRRTWGECEVYEYAYTGPGSSYHPSNDVQAVMVGKLDITHEEYTLTVKKVDSTNPNKGLSGARFLVASENGAYSKEVVTGADGTATLYPLVAGTYAVTELEAPAGYEIDNAGPQYVVLPSNGSTTVTVTFTDTPEITGEGSIRKVDADDPTKGLAGAVIKITGVDNGFTGTYVTGAGGYLTDVPWKDMPLGSYTAEEITPPEGYSLSPDVSKTKQTFVWDGKTDVALVFENDAKVKIRLDKKPNGLILGTPGSGKSFSAKREILNVFLVTDDDILIADPEAEYYPLVQRLDGQVIKISPTSKQYVNPMDLNLDYSDDESPLSLKVDFLLSFCDIVVGSKDGLQPVEKTVIDRCVRLVYQKYLTDPRPENMPILEDLYDALRAQEEKEAQFIATALEIYVTGSLNVFNHRTNVDIDNRIVCYDIKELGKQLKQLGMLVIQDQVWNRVTVNRAAGKATRYYVDEFHLLLKGELASWSVEIWKRFRKWGGIPTGITQNSKDLLASPEISNILENSDFIYMLNQAAGDRKILAKQLNISPHQLSYVTHSGEGEGLLFYGNVILPFVDRFPKDTELYRIMTTKPQEISG